MADARAAVRVRIARLRGAHDLPLPARATRGAAGFDLHAAVEAAVVIAPRERTLIPTGFAIAVPEGYELVDVRPCDHRLNLLQALLQLGLQAQAADQADH